MTKRVLVTGGAGFVGARIVRACLREGWQVAVLYQPENGLSQIQDILDQVRLYPVLGRDGEVFEVFADFQPELVFHLASVFVAQHTSDDILPLLNANVVFGSLILEAMSRCGVRYLINTGTSWQHYNTEDYSPVNLYAGTKQAFEDILRYYVEAEGFQAITLKLYDTYGPLDPRPKLFSLLESAAGENSTLKMSPGRQSIDLVYIDDVVDAFIVAANRLFEGKSKHHEVYAVSSGNSLQLRDLVAAYSEITGKDIKVEWGGRAYRRREVMVPWAGGKPLPGWHPKVSLEQGIRNCQNVKAVETSIPSVTVCIPVYNCQAYIAQAIESVLSQTFSDFELLIVDNASTDGTMEVIARYTDPRIRLIRNKVNIGLEGNWNKAVTEARGKYVKLLPADDFLYPKCLETQIEVFERPKNASLAIVSCARDIVDPNGKKLITRKPLGRERVISGFKSIRNVLGSGTNLLGEPGAILFKRSLLEKTGVFDGKLIYVIDVHLWLRMLLHGNLYVIPETLCAFRLSSGSASLELATLQSRHFTLFINNFAGDAKFGVRWIDRVRGIITSQLLGFARKVFYILTVHKDVNHD
jgi:nucleoside-diphosphate-sugar epimerase/glycosyltransferase involved in cell wall biosynthesis